MAFGPLDIVKTQEVTQIKQIENQRSQHTQDQISRNFQNIVQQEHTKPVQATKAENTEYRYDAKEKGNNQYTNDKKKKNEDKKKKELNQSKEPPKAGGIDIFI